jgi:hypothetical protein
MKLADFFPVIIFAESTFCSTTRISLVDRNEYHRIRRLRKVGNPCSRLEFLVFFDRMEEILEGVEAKSRTISSSISSNPIFNGFLSRISFGPCV